MCPAKSDGNIQRPDIQVFCSREWQDGALFEGVLLGIEEEGIPICLVEKDGDSAVSMAFEAAEKSTLGVGIGIGPDRKIVLHYEKLPKEEPLFLIALHETAKHRAIGANAARLVKRLPFKSLDLEEEIPMKRDLQDQKRNQPEETPAPETSSNISEADIASIIKQVLHRLDR